MGLFAKQYDFVGWDKQRRRAARASVQSGQNLLYSHVMKDDSQVMNVNMLLSCWPRVTVTSYSLQSY